MDLLAVEADFDRSSFRHCYMAKSVYSVVTGNSISYSAQFGSSPAFQI